MSLGGGPFAAACDGDTREGRDRHPAGRRHRDRDRGRQQRPPQRGRRAGLHLHGHHRRLHHRRRHRVRLQQPGSPARPVRARQQHRLVGARRHLRQLRRHVDGDAPRGRCLRRPPTGVPRTHDRPDTQRPATTGVADHLLDRRREQRPPPPASTCWPPPRPPWPHRPVHRQGLSPSPVSPAPPWPASSRSPTTGRPTPSTCVVTDTLPAGLTVISPPAPTGAASPATSSAAAPAQLHQAHPADRDLDRHHLRGPGRRHREAGRHAQQHGQRESARRLTRTRATTPPRPRSRS